MLGAIEGNYIIAFARPDDMNNTIKLLKGNTKNMDKFIFWDFYNTIAYCGCLYGKALKGVLDEFEPGNKISCMQINKCIMHKFTWDNPINDYSEIKDPEKWWEYTNPIFEKAYEAIGISEQNAKIYARNVRKYVADSSLYSLYPETVETLEMLAQNGYTQYIVSNFAPVLIEIIKGLKIEHYFKEFIVSSLSGYEKPNKSLFEIALKKAGNPEKVWMIGDSFDADYKGASSCNIKTVLVRNEPPQPIEFFARDIKIAAQLIINHDKA